ncbi:MAG TPA: DUF4349 domain-containing protein [Acidobacteriota bacterium]|nr:DUF4349 domain-containing protein [Acidobacteriota bacterium]
MSAEHSEQQFEAFCEDLEAYVEGALSDVRRREIESFLKDSAEARELLAEFQQANSLFTAPEWDVPEPHHLPTAQVILDRAREQTPFWYRWWQHVGGLLPKPLTSPVFASALALIVLFSATWYVVRPTFLSKPEMTAMQKDTAPPAGAAAPASSTVPAAPSREPVGPSARPAEGPAKQAAPASPAQVAPDPALGDELDSPAADLKKEKSASEGQVQPSSGARMEETAKGGESKNEREDADGLVAQSQPEMAAAAPKKADDSIAYNKVAAPSPPPAPGAAGAAATGPTKPSTTITASEMESPDRNRKAASEFRAKAPKPADQGSSRQQLRSVTLVLVPPNPETARTRVASVTQQTGGQVLSSRQSGTAYLIVTSRIPASQLDAYLSKIRSLGTITKEQQEALSAAARRETDKNLDRSKDLRDDESGYVTVVVQIRLTK